jgi:Holliday junction resolvase RusA-like endonuclease
MIDTPQTNRKGAGRRFIIKGCLCTLNEYTRATRANKMLSARIKREQEQVVSWSIRQWLNNWKAKKPVFVKFTWVEKNKRKDKDNIAFAKKFILDALVKCGTIADDKWDNVVGFSDKFEIDKDNPRVEVEIFELQ